jgi:hypothetical protein
MKQADNDNSKISRQIYGSIHDNCNQLKQKEKTKSPYTLHSWSTNRLTAGVTGQQLELRPSRDHGIYSQTILRLRLKKKFLCTQLNATISQVRMIDWLIIYGFTSRSRIFHLYGDVTITCEGLQNLGLCSALGSFEQGRIFILCHTCCDTGPPPFQSHSKDRPI